MIPDAAVAAAAKAFAHKLAWCDRHSIDPRRENGLALRAAIEAAAAHLSADAWAEGHESGFWNGRESAGCGEMLLIGIEHAEATNPYRR